MSTQPRNTETVEQRFGRLAAVWLGETGHISSTTQLVAHPAFQEIVGLGPAVIPCLLRELERRSAHWHWALERITHVDPVPPGSRDNLDRAAEAWLRWGREHGYQW